MTWRSDTPRFPDVKLRVFSRFFGKTGSAILRTFDKKKGIQFTFPFLGLGFLKKKIEFIRSTTPCTPCCLRDARSPTVRVLCRQGDRREHVDGGRGDRGRHRAALVPGGRIPAGPGAHELDPAGFHLRQTDVDVADEQQHVVPDHIKRDQVRHRLVLLCRQQRHWQRVVSVRVADRGT